MLNEAINLFFKISNPHEINIKIFFNACSQIGTREILPLVKQVLSNLPNCQQLSCSNNNLPFNKLDLFKKIWQFKKFYLELNSSASVITGR